MSVRSFKGTIMWLVEATASPIFLTVHGTLAHRQDSVSQRMARCFRKDTVDTARRHLSTVQLPVYMSTGFNGIASCRIICSGLLLDEAFVEGKHNKLIVDRPMAADQITPPTSVRIPRAFNLSILFRKTNVG
jgi:hypothetical protein